MPPRRRRRPRESFDLGEFSLSHANLIALALQAYGISPAAPDALARLHRRLTKEKLRWKNVPAQKVSILIRKKSRRGKIQKQRAEVTWIKRIPRRGRKSEGLHLTVEMAAAGVTDRDTAPAAARKLATYRGQPPGDDGLIQKIRRHRRKRKKAP